MEKTAGQRKTEICHIIHSKLLEYQEQVAGLKLSGVNIYVLPHETIPILRCNLNDLIELYSELGKVQKELNEIVNKQ